MDIGSLVPSPERIIEILHPGTEQPLGIKVSICSVDDERMKKIKRVFSDRALKLQRKGKGFDAADIDANLNELCFTAMSGWVWERPIIEPATATKEPVYGEAPTFDGDTAPVFNRVNVDKIFARLPWFRDQIETAIGETKDFFQH